MSARISLRPQSGTLHPQRNHSGNDQADDTTGDDQTVDPAGDNTTGDNQTVDPAGDNTTGDNQTLDPPGDDAADDDRTPRVSGFRVNSARAPHAIAQSLSR
ncbi:hypothetical protein B1T48_03495 [Mycobacterium persicum]|nr:hypothetical protein A4G31_04100 [Mycobacterium persicum]ORB93817.1 hypothetical protein B1T44_03885 [Mycobacterium persicum]ORC00553.1 hypothetical protein B1T48_03495 [Mycobacterium persicum]